MDLGNFYQNLEKCLRELSVESLSITMARNTTLESSVVARALIINSHGMPIGTEIKAGETVMEAVEGLLHDLLRREGKI
jgi:hypothetical protein